ncbi:hypothetical protein C1H46_004554 [Malus baccata]|uniref:DUF2828 domain-containing protein n=1 Tax=Malus baccata TaxID=106549 RepID=A0A540NGX8_MALBA|nr:hypothetical protein C1H46_004554 [Malus baccata]
MSVITTVMFDVLLQVLLGDAGAGKSSLVLRFVKEQFVEFQHAETKSFGRNSQELLRLRLLCRSPSSSNSNNPGFHNINNPCIDLYFHCTKGQDAMSTVEFHETLMNQMLPSAWSHNPLTTIKLICNFIDKRGDGGKRNQDEAFFTVVAWLHQNHPKTLAYNCANFRLFRTYPRPSLHSLAGSTGRSSLEIYWDDEGGGGFKWNDEGEDFNSRAEYVQTMTKSQDWTADFGKVFDVILEEAMNANLKPNKMVKKVLALTTYKHFLTGSNFSFWGETKMSPFLLLVSATTFTSPKLSFFP